MKKVVSARSKEITVGVKLLAELVVVFARSIIMS